MLPTPVGDVTADPILYPRMHLLRDGSVFVSSRINGFQRNICVDPVNGSARPLSPLPDPAYHGFDCPSVLLPLAPNDNYRPRVLLAGGVRSQLIDLGQANPTWIDVPRDVADPGVRMRPGATVTALVPRNNHIDLFATGTDGAVWSTFWEPDATGWRNWFLIRMVARPRTHACATLLPTGDVLLTGGAAPDNDQLGVMEPELYDPPLDRRQARYLEGTGRWRIINDPASVLRNYHSTALLMPDGRVWTAGGNSPNQPGQPPTSVQEQIEIYEPPYPAGPRPKITSCPSFVSYNSEFSVRVPNAGAIACTVLMRCGSSTHAFNSDQRAILLRFRTSGTDTIIATAPPSGAIAPPGSYMVFVVDIVGRPCEYARFINVRA
jgi:hypothetical protein